MKLFDNTEIAFASKSDAALERAYFLFRLISNQPLVKIGTHIAHFALKSQLPVEGSLELLFLIIFVVALQPKNLSKLSIFWRVKMFMLF